MTECFVTVGNIEFYQPKPEDIRKMCAERISQELSQIPSVVIDLVLGILGEFRKNTESACPYKTQILFQVQCFGLKPTVAWKNGGRIKVSKVYRVS